jgi:hypothetical protein
MAPELPLGFWQAIEEIWPKTRGQHYWVHKIANILNKLPKSQHAKGERALQEIWDGRNQGRGARGTGDLLPQKADPRCSGSRTARLASGNAAFLSPPTAAGAPRFHVSIVSGAIENGSFNCSSTERPQQAPTCQKCLRQPPMRHPSRQRCPFRFTYDERLFGTPTLIFLFDGSTARNLSSQARSRERATSRFSGSTASYCRRARSAS